LSYDTKFFSFLEINTTLHEIASGIPENLVPTIIHDGRIVQDSYEIAKYLDNQFPSPSLLHNQEGVHRYLTHYIESEISPLISKLVCLKVYAELDDENKKYYRTTREARFNTTLEHHVGNEENNFASLVEKIQIIDRMLMQFVWISGSQIGWADIVTASWLLFLETFQPQLHSQLLDKYPSIAAWQKKIQQYKTAYNQ
jgi:glutathione S-transferase